MLRTARRPRGVHTPPASLFTADTAQHKASTDGANLPPGFELLDLKGYMVADKKGAKKGAAAKATKTTKGGTKAKTTIAEPANDIDVEKATAGDEEGDTDDEESEEEQEVLPVSRRACRSSCGTGGGRR